MVKKYDVWRTLDKGGKAFLAYALPAWLAWLIDSNPQIASLTLGTLAMMLINWLKHRNR